MDGHLDGTTPMITLSVLANDTDPDGNQHLVASSVKIVVQPAHGTAVANADGSITYTANAGFSRHRCLAQYTISRRQRRRQLARSLLYSRQSAYCWQ